MNEHTDKGKGFLKDKLGGYQADPPQEVWDSISASLSGRKRRGVSIILLAAAASIALAVTLGITYFGRDIPHEQELAGQEVNPVRVESGELDQAVEPEIALKEPAASTEGRLPARKSQRVRLEDRVAQTLTEVSTTETIEVMMADQEINSQVSPGQSEEELGNSKASLALTENLPELSVETAEPRETGESVETAEPRETAESMETVGDDIPEELILNAGEVKDVEIQPDIGEMPDRDHRWVLGAMLSPLYSFRDAEPEALAGTAGQESGMISYATGVHVGYRATRRLALESGVIYNKMGLSIGAPGIQVFEERVLIDAMGPDSWGENVMAIANTVGNIVSHSGEIYVNNYKLNASPGYNSSNEVFAGAAMADQGIRQHLDYLEVPLNLRYTMLDRSFKIQLIGGVSTNLLVNNYVTMETPDGTTEIGYLTNIRNVNYSGNAGIGFVYHFLDQLSLNVEPRFRYYLNSVNDATLPSTRPYTFGIYTGLNFFF